MSKKNCTNLKLEKTSFFGEGFSSSRTNLQSLKKRASRHEIFPFFLEKGLGSTLAFFGPDPLTELNPDPDLKHCNRK
jgi:hypothetical protein